MVKSVNKNVKAGESNIFLDKSREKNERRYTNVVFKFDTSSYCFSCTIAGSLLLFQININSY